MSQDPPPPPPSSQPTPPPPVPGAGDADRAAAYNKARRRAASKVNFLRNMVVWVFLAIVCIVIWLLSGRGYFWPGWVLFALVVSGFWMWLAAYGPRDREPTEAEIEEELRRQQGR